ncbi:MAG: hypothetical protein ACJA1A_001494 [Saprospiraceae bacterium]|jgi:hypothetical protein|tara:strand:+ start:1334 stop:1480 length:147 start_codon:yes stop_codon:yes gene_type:complete
MELGKAAQYILTTNGETPLGEKYFYRENQGIWYIITLISRKESEEKLY